MLRVVHLLSAASIAAVMLAISGCGSEMPEVVDVNDGNAKQLRKRFASEGGEVGSGPTNPLLTRTEASWATIKGTITISGAPPSDGTASLAAGQLGACRQTSTSVPVGSMVVGSGSGIKSVVLYLDTKLPEDDSDKPNPVFVNAKYKIDPTKPPPSFDQIKCLFEDRIFVFRSQQTIHVKNSDTVGHNTDFGQAKRANKGNFTIAPGSYVEYVAGNEETSPFPISCAIHPWMGMNLLPRDNPYFDVTADDGAYALENVLAQADLTFRIWHERAGFLNDKDITLSGDTEGFSWKRGRLTVNLEAGKEYNLNLEIDAAAFK